MKLHSAGDTLSSYSVFLVFSLVVNSEEGLPSDPITNTLLKKYLLVIDFLTNFFEIPVLLVLCWITSPSPEFILLKVDCRIEL